jgi:hypothetical protein
MRRVPHPSEVFVGSTTNLGAPPFRGFCWIYHKFGCPTLPRFLLDLPQIWVPHPWIFKGGIHESAPAAFLVASRRSIAIRFPQSRSFQSRDHGRRVPHPSEVFVGSTTNLGAPPLDFQGWDSRKRMPCFSPLHGDSLKRPMLPTSLRHECFLILASCRDR